MIPNLRKLQGGTDQRSDQERGGRDVEVEIGGTGGPGRPCEEGVCGLSFGRLVGCR